jgi:hypothetical protein
LREPPTPLVEMMNARSRDAGVVRRRLGTSFELRFWPWLVQVDVGREAHLRRSSLERVLADDEGGVGRRHDALQHGRGDGRHARDDDGSGLQCSEDDLEPVDGRPADHEHAISGLMPDSRSVVAQMAAPSAIS